MAQVGSLVGDAMLNGAIGLAVFRVTGSPLQTTASIIVGSLPSLLFSLRGGAIADRRRRSNLLMAGDAISVVVIAPLFFLRHGTTWLVYPLEFLAASVAAVYGPVSAALIPDLTGPAGIARGYGRYAQVSSLATFGAPALGAYVFARTGLTWVVAIDALSFLFAVLAVSRIHEPERHAVRDTDGRATTWSVLRRFAGHSRLTAALQLRGLMACSSAMLGAALVPLLLVALGVGASRLAGVILLTGTAGLVGNLLAGALCQRLPPSTINRFAIPCWAASLAAVAVSRNLGAVAVAASVANLVIPGKRRGDDHQRATTGLP